MTGAIEIGFEAVGFPEACPRPLIRACCLALDHLVRGSELASVVRALVAAVTVVTDVAPLRGREAA